MGKTYLDLGKIQIECIMLRVKYRRSYFDFMGFGLTQEVWSVFLVNFFGSKSKFRHIYYLNFFVLNEQAL